MLSLLRLLAFITLITLNSTNIVDNVVRKCFGKGKVIPREERFPKYAFWGRAFILLTFFILGYFVGTESWHIHLLGFLLCATIYTFEAILEKKYIKKSNDYLFTFWAGLLKALLSVILVMFLSSTGS